MAIIELHIPISTSMLNNGTCQVTNVLAEHCQLSISVIKQAISKGALWLERANSVKRLRRLKTSLKPSDTLHFYYNSDVLEQVVDDAVLINDFDDYSIWYKPYGMLCQGSKWSDHCTINRFVEQYFEHQRSCFIVHRLDRAASGLIILAHTKKATRAFGRLFEQHDLLKRYHINVFGDARQLKEAKVVTEPIDNKPAKSTFSTVEFDEKMNVSLLSVDIDTGRKHQIRKHAAGIGFPVIGDRLHGIERIESSIEPSKNENDGDKHCEPSLPVNAETNQQEIQQNNNLQLCAVRLAFECPLSSAQRDVKLPEKYGISLAKLNT